MINFTYPVAVPPGFDPPLALATPDDQRAWIYVVALLGFSFAICSILVRVWIRINVKANFGPDDALLAAATVFGLIQTILVMRAGVNGLGQASHLITPLRHQDTALRLYHDSNFFYVLSLGFSRLSILSLIRRLTPVAWHLRMIDAGAAFLAVWMVVSLVMIGVQCDHNAPWRALSDQCTSSWYARWVAIEVVGAITEVSVFAFVVFCLVWGLQTSRKRKADVALAFSFRLLTIVPVGSRLSAYSYASFVQDPTRAPASFIIWGLVEMNYSLVAATIPMARSFMASLKASWGGAGGLSLMDIQSSTNPNGTNDSQGAIGTRKSGRWGESIVMNTLRSKESARDKDGLEDDVPLKLSPTDAMPGGSYRIEVTSASNEDATSVRSKESRKMFIRKHVSYETTVDAL